MIRRKRGLGSSGSTVTRGARISIQLDSRIGELSDMLGVTMSQLVAEATLIGVTRLEEQYGIPESGDCSDVVDSDSSTDMTISRVEDNDEEQED
jgi:hypothetical protein